MSSISLSVKLTGPYTVNLEPFFAPASVKPTAAPGADFLEAFLAAAAFSFSSLELPFPLSAVAKKNAHDVTFYDRVSSLTIYSGSISI